MILSSSNLLALQTDLYYIREYLEELEQQRRAMKSRLPYAIFKAHNKELSNLHLKIDRIAAIIHVFSRALLLGKQVVKGDDEEDFIFTLFELCSLMQKEISVAAIHNVKFINVIENLHLHFSDDTWEKVSQYITQLAEENPGSL